MCTILLPIKPEYVDKILNKAKLYEYRKKISKKNVDKIIIYCTSPVKKVVADVEVTKIVTNTPDKLWNDTKLFSGIAKDKYMKYFANSNIAFAYELGKVNLYDKPKNLEEIGINYYPQSYVYID